ncbi:MAG: sulfatase-like hydrolase/transferase, partial [Armatimonadota bacterium]
GLEIGPGPLGNAYAKWLENKRPGAYMEIYEQRQQPEYKKQRGAVINVLDEDEYVDYWVAQMGIEFMERRDQDQPWFLWVGFCGPHGPCDPPRRYAQMYDIDEMPVPDTWLDPLEDKPEFMRRERPDEMSEEDRLMLQRFYAYYHAEMTFIDAMMKRLLQRLEELGFADDTIVCTTSDHGEMLGQFGRFGKGNFFEPVTRIPTIWRLPDGNPVDRFDGLTETFQVAPTVLDFAGVEIPPQMAARSLRPILEGEQTDGQEAVMCEYMDNYRRYAGHCIRTERYKYANWGTEYTGELYDLQEDPGELNNLWDDPEYAGLRQKMADLLMDRQLHTQEPAYDAWLHKRPEHVEEPGWGRARPR